MKWKSPLFLTTIIILISIFCFYENNFFVAVVSLLWAVIRLHEMRQQAFVDYTFWRESNVLLDVSISIEEVLKDICLDDLYLKLKKKNIIQQDTKDDWFNLLLTNYKTKYSVNDEGYPSLKFRIKSDLLWKNDTVDFDDVVYHEIFIPYQLKDGKELDDRPLFTPSIEVGLIVRVLMINGYIKIQLGDFSKEYSPTIFVPGSVGVYETYKTITSFPLIYFSWKHKIPPYYLNLSMVSTDSWKKWVCSEKKAPKKAMGMDWQLLAQEMKQYRYLCKEADKSGGDYGKFIETDETFAKKRQLLLDTEGFKNVFDDDETIRFANKFLLISIYDCTHKRDYTDYYRETYL